MPFTNENGRFQTNIDKGYAHGSDLPRGSVSANPINGRAGHDYTLWLEHVVEHKGTLEQDDEWFWFVWYSPKGVCTTKTSAVFKAKDLAETMRQFIEALHAYSPPQTSPAPLT